VLQTKTLITGIAAARLIKAAGAAGAAAAILDPEAAVLQCDSLTCHITNAMARPTAALT
jgi:hypothetical protein